MPLLGVMVPEPDEERPGPAPPGVVIVYVVAGVLWIVTTSAAVEAVSRGLGISPAAVELVKGVLFVLVTAGVLWMLLHRWQQQSLLAMRRGRADLERREQRFRNLAEQTEGSVYRIEFRPAMHLEYVSPQFEELTGFSAEQLRDDPDLLLRNVHHEDRELLDVLGVEDLTAASVEPGVTTFRFRRADGEWIWLEDHHTPEVGPDGRITADLGITFDVTARHRQEEARAEALDHERRASEHLRRTVEAQQTFLSSISHELRTPLTGIVGFASTLEVHGDDLGPEQRRLVVTRLAANATRLQRLLDDLLDLDRLQRGVLDLHVTDGVDLAQLVRTIVDAIEAPAHRIELDLSPTPVSLDVPKVERIIENLLRNAVKHTPAGTSVRMRAIVDDEGLLLEVEDDGPGLGTDGQDLFEPFQQGAKAMDDPNPGTGIGLSLVRDFAVIHDGSVWHEVVEPHGARFCVRLPQP